jgi:transcription-repair coupling factor (superfamily II helicase)
VTNSAFLSLYSEDSFSKTVFHAIDTNSVINLYGLVGSIDAVLIASYFTINQKTQFIILEDREDAAYFFNDLQSLLEDDSTVMFFPSSYKKPYQYEETDNANVLMRSEVLNRLNEDLPLIVVSYPEAIAEKVVNKQSLVANTLLVKKGDSFASDFVIELLVSYDFERTDFVYEPGQFSVRGGIIDIFSYASDKPFRIELFGNEVETIRYFDPSSQLSVKEVNHVAIVPDIQSRLTLEKREAIFSFIRNKFTIWIKNIQFILDRLDDSFRNVENYYTNIIEKSGVSVINKPADLFISGSDFVRLAEEQKVVQLSKKSYFKNATKLTYKTTSQPSFNKEFTLLLNDLGELQANGFSTFICSESPKQLERLEQIFRELDPNIHFKPLHLSLRHGFIDDQLKISCYTDHQIFEKYHHYRIKDRFSKSKALTLKELKSLKPGDFVTHIDYGIGRFAGMETIEVNEKNQEVIRLVYRDNDLLYVNIHALHKIAKYAGKEGIPPTMSKLGSGEWETKKSRVKKQVADIAEELIKLYAQRRSCQGFAFSADNYMQYELESSFIYEDTPDQAKSSKDVKEDMEKPYPMDRLVCGDVGFGKTEVAIRAAFKAACDNKQVAILVPTTILAMQHHKTFSERLAKFPVTVDYINRFKSTKEVSETTKKMKEGKVDILIGTHAILNKKLDFKDLGLLIIDEEQKFGVKAKDRIKELKLNVDVLTLTATPIPRTLHFSLMGARDLSVISTPPPNRFPVSTEVTEFREEIIRDAISFELQRGGQVFFVHNRVNDIESIGNIILRLVPDARVGVAHGQMEGSKLEKMMMKFINGEIDVLISTNIIEAGLDIPNANTIMINQAHMFGLSDLHQMRGRVGRSNKKAFCYLLTQPLSLLSKDARKRLQTLEEFSELGDGFKVAMRDLDIRGAGNLLGAEQSGFVNDLGYEVYHKILDDAVKELKESKFKELFMNNDTSSDSFISQDCQIETDLAVLIPDTYITNISERLGVYNEIDNLKNEAALTAMEKSLIDRFGKLPAEVENLFVIVKIRWMAENLGFEKLTIKNTILKGYFVSSQQSTYFQSEKFGKILDYAKHNKRCQLKQVKEKLLFVVEKVNSVEKAFLFLNELTKSTLSL